MTRINRGKTYAGETAPQLSVATIQQVIREQAAQQIPPGDLPEDRVAPSADENDIIVTRDGKSVWMSAANLPAVVAAHEVEIGATPPSDTSKLWIDTTTTETFGIPQSLLTTRGDLIRRGASAPERVALGTAGAALVSDGTDAVWRSTFHVISERAARYAAGIGTSAFYIGAGNQILYAGTTGAAASMVYIDPADWGGTSCRVKLRAWCQTETDPTNSTLVAALSLTTATGASGTLSSATVVVSSDVGVTAANQKYPIVTAEATITTAGWYIVGFQHDVNPAQAMTYGYTLMGRSI